MKDAANFWIGVAISLSLGVLWWTIIKPNKQIVTTTYTTIPPITLTTQTIDAELGSEFSAVLTSNVNYGIINMRDGRMLNLTVTNAEHTVTFTNPIHWLPTNTIPYAASNSVTLFNFMQRSNTIYGSVMRQNYFEDETKLDSATNRLTN